jgi:hypothetical protein
MRRRHRVVRRGRSQRPKLDAFARAYVEAALWASTDESGEPLDKDYDVGDIATETLSEMADDCAKFERAQEKNLDEARDEHGYDIYERAGHDLFLSRNGHGAGFFDRDLGDVGDRLQEAARKMGGYDLYVGDDGKIYGSRG